MEPVIACADQALAVLHAQQAVPGAEIPASRPLEQVPPQGGHVADLGRPDFERRLQERRVRLAHPGIRDDVGQPGTRADRQATRPGFAGDSGHFLDILQIDHAIRGGNVVFHPADQVGAARKGGRPRRSKEFDSIIDRRGRCILKGFHGSRLPFSGRCGQGVQDIPWTHRPLGHAHSDGIGHGVADGRGRRDGRGLADSVTPRGF